MAFLEADLAYIDTATDAIEAAVLAWLASSEPTQAEIEPCGSWRAIHFIEGYVYEERWCERTAGPCPYPGTAMGDRNDRECAARAVHSPTEPPQGGAK